MKKLIFLFLLTFLSACRGINYVQSDISRNQIYYGQSVTDLFDNFGTPVKAEQYNYNVIAYIFRNDRIIQKNSDKFLSYCDLRVYTQERRVIDWDWMGTNCQFDVNEKVKMTLFDDYEPEGQ